MSRIFIKKTSRFTILITAVLLLFCHLSISSQVKKKNNRLKVKPSKYKLVSSGVSYDGIESVPYVSNGEYLKSVHPLLKYQIGEEMFYPANGSPRVSDEGLVIENMSDKTTRVFPMFHLAEAVGWYKPTEGNGSYPDAIRGLFPVGDKFYMGSNGIGIAVYDTKQKTWSRYDDKLLAVPGAHVQLYWADKDYMFLTGGEFPYAGMHIYSMKADKGLRLEAVPNKSIVELGTNSGQMVQVVVDDRIYAKSEYMPIDWHLAMINKVSPVEDNNAYLFERNYSEKSRTAYKITKSQLEKAFEGK